MSSSGSIHPLSSLYSMNITEPQLQEILQVRTNNL